MNKREVNRLLKELSEVSSTISTCYRNMGEADLKKLKDKKTGLVRKINIALKPYGQEILEQSVVEVIKGH